MNLDGYLRSMNKGQGERKNIQMTLDYTLFTNDTHLFHFSFFMGKKEIINWKPKKCFMLLFVSAIHGSMVLETYLHHCACISLLTEGLQH